MSSRKRWFAIAVVGAAVTAPLLYAQFKASSRRVEVYATVFDNQGHPMDGLEKNRLTVLDNGAPQPILSFESAGDDISIAILIDTTGSMNDTLPSVKNAVSKMLEQMRPGDAAAVYGFNISLVTLQDFTTDKAAARTAVLRMRAAGGTALFDAIAGVSQAIADRPGKKAIVLFADGADNSSQLKANAAIRRAVKTGVPIYAVAEGDALQEGALLKQLRSVAAQTGGVCYQARNSKEVARVFGDIQSELKHVYLFSYKPPDGMETNWRTIQLLIGGAKDYKIRGKQGYFPE
ncbi:MAG: hypothetical protein QOJ99_5466 [Bryobacterales bacterium]|jgi:VWFA-related protein|nr:hypothetical protein [Bryobacterales bacterium]